MKINTPPLRSRQSLMRKVAPIVAALPLLGFVGAGVAHADTTAPQSKTIAATVTDFSSSASFTQFNPSLGTLTQVDWTIALNGNVNGTVKNNSANPATFEIDEKTQFAATGPNSSTLNANPLTTTQTYSGLASGASANFGPFTPSSSATTTVTGAGLAGYVGAGTFTFNLSTLTGTTILGGGGNVSANITTTAGGTATVVYTYTPSASAAPEPGSLALLALPALSATGLVIRRRRNV